MKNLTENDPRTFTVIGAAMEVHRFLVYGRYTKRRRRIEFTNLRNLRILIRERK
jgi:hypothetical protein